MFNEEALNKARNKYVGFSALLSTKFKDSLDALAVYHEKDIIEKCFDDSKNELDKRRLRVHGSKRYEKPSLHSVYCDDSSRSDTQTHARDGADNKVQCDSAAVGA